jgi:hypothetical protein
MKFMLTAFLPDDDYLLNEDVNVLREADGTGSFMIKKLTTVRVARFTTSISFCN